MKLFNAAFVFCAAVSAVCASCGASLSEIKVELKLSASDYVTGERIRGVVEVVNSSPDVVSCGFADSSDRLFVEVFKAGNMEELRRKSKSAFVAEFALRSGESERLETFLGDHFPLLERRRYLAKPVLVHGGMRYEGQLRAFDVVDGLKIGGAVQMFNNAPSLRRDFEIVYWSRNHGEHLFLKAKDSGSSSRGWETRDLGPILRIEKPTIGILKTGEVIVFHRLNQDQFMRSEFWSLPGELEARPGRVVSDPEKAGTSRVRELYKDGGVKPKENPWWKFW